MDISWVDHFGFVVLYEISLHFFFYSFAPIPWLAFSLGGRGPSVSFEFLYSLFVMGSFTFFFFLRFILSMALIKWQLSFYFCINLGALTYGLYSSHVTSYLFCFVFFCCLRFPGACFTLRPLIGVLFTFPLCEFFIRGVRLCFFFVFVLVVVSRYCARFF